MKAIARSGFLRQKMLVSGARLLGLFVGQHTGAAESANRPFRMRFTGFVYDMIPEAVSVSREFVRENGDILAHHISYFTNHGFLSVNKLFTLPN